MPTELLITAEDADETRGLFELLVDRADTLKASGLTFRAKGGAASPLTVGLPEITDLIIALGTAGAFAAFSNVLRSYFNSHPRGILTISSRNSTSAVRITATNCDPAKVAAALKAIVGNVKSESGPPNG
jgi:hypothetical protein